MADSYKVTEISNPASVGWRWTTDGGSEWEICWLRGSHQLTFGCKPAEGPSAGQWVHYGMMCGAAWEHDGTVKGARSAARLFINGV